MFRIVRIVGLALALLGGVAAAQGPEFAQQYAQRLGGALDELRRQIATLDADAKATGNTRDGAVDRLRTSPDALVSRRGEAVRGDIERLDRLEGRRRAMADSGSPLGRFVAMVRDPDLAVARAAYRDYAPAVPTTADGFAAGLIGFFGTWWAWRLVSDTGRRLSRLRAAPRTPETTAA